MTQQSSNKKKNPNVPVYDESSYKKLEFPESIRRRPGMYIGKLGNGQSPDDGIYILAKEGIDNCIDEFQMGNGKQIRVSLTQIPGQPESLQIEDFGRGIPLGVLKECASEVHGGAKFDSMAFQKSVGMNGVGIKAVNALSDIFSLSSIRDKKRRTVTYSKGKLTSDKTEALKDSTKLSGTTLEFSPDQELFPDYSFEEDYIKKMAFQYACLNPGLTITMGVSRTLGANPEVTEFHSEAGLLDYLNHCIKEGGGETSLQYPPIHLRNESGDIDICLTHGHAYGEEIHSFVNGQNTHQGGTHVAAFREAIVTTLREFTGKNYESSDVRGAIIAAIAVRLQEPVFESQTKTKLGSTHTQPLGAGIPIRSFVGDFVKRELGKYLHKYPEVAKRMEARIIQNERERKELSGIREKSRELGKRASIVNRKLRDCKYHRGDKNPMGAQSTLFITEGDSASGSITAVRDSQFQAVFNLKGKPANSFGKTRKLIYENEELHLLQSALGVENDPTELRYAQVVIATDADVDGMHIRLLLSTFFLQYFPDIVREGVLHILQTPLFRVRNKKETRYCYTEEERINAIKSLGSTAEITRFKGLGEISPNEFKDFIGPKMRLSPLILDANNPLEETMRFFMGPNTPERQRFLCENLTQEID
jgi:topoisomerase-4 subunit B